MDDPQLNQFRLTRITKEHVTVMAPHAATDDQLFRLADASDNWALSEIETRIVEEN